MSLGRSCAQSRNPRSARGSYQKLHPLGLDGTSDSPPDMHLGLQMVPDRSLRWMPAVIGVAVLAATVPLALSRDFGVFLAAMFLCAPALLFASLGLVVWGFAEGRLGRKISIYSAVVVIVITARGLYDWEQVPRPDRVCVLVADARCPTQPLHDSRRHHFDLGRLGNCGHGKRLVPRCGSWQHALFDRCATRWIRRRGWKCQIVDVQQMRHGLYILTTFECPLER